MKVVLMVSFSSGFNDERIVQGYCGIGADLAIKVTLLASILPFSFRDSKIGQATPPA